MSERLEKARIALRVHLNRLSDEEKESLRLEMIESSTPKQQQKEQLKQNFLDLLKTCGDEGVFSGEDQGIMVVYARKSEEGFKSTAIADGNGFLISNSLIQMMSQNPSIKAVVYEATKKLAKEELNMINEQNRVSKLGPEDIN